MIHASVVAMPAGDRPIERTDGGVAIRVRVVPRSARSEIAGVREGELLVRLHASPVEGAANAELVEVIASAFGVPKRAVALVSGEKSKHKRVAVHGITEAQALPVLYGAIARKP